MVALLVTPVWWAQSSLDEKLRAATARRGPSYKPRTRHLKTDGSAQFTNRLILESSPYLVQHAHNPVQWYPWGNEAFETARKLRRPVLLSVGYSTCHWCHVMEEESFEDLEIARYLNDNYVAVKVDREERPDIDAIYMSVVQALTGRGGWPMTVWLTPDRKPFYGATYLPPRDGDRGADHGFLTVLQKLREIYDTQPERVAESSSHITEKVREAMGPRGKALTADLPGGEVLREAARYCQEHFDATHGGARGAPKFPSSLPHRFLLRYYRRTGDPQALRMASLTLEKMAAGGIYDHVGGGFHRYATDERWLVPHFEKMLYDNALLAVDYLEAHQATGREDFARIAREILQYIARDMTSPQGAFYSATDADSPGPQGKRVEGFFFTWTPSEIAMALGGEQARVINSYYALTEKGNFEGRNILHTPAPFANEKARGAIEASRELLYAARKKRPPPLRDEKILTAWNGLMISAYARAAAVLHDEEYARRAARAAAFVLKNLRKENRLLRSFMDGRASHQAYLSDYAFLMAGLLDLYEATSDQHWFREALNLDRVLERWYEDAERGGFFLTSHDHEPLLAREKPSHDGAEPSGNSVAVLNLLRLYEFTTDDRYRRRAERVLRVFEDGLKSAPAAFSEMLLAVDFYLDTPKQIILVGQGVEPFLGRLRRTFLPNRVLAVVSSAGGPAELSPLIEGKIALKGKATAYVCERQVCQLPTTDPEVFAKQIRKVQPLP